MLPRCWYVWSGSKATVGRHWRPILMCSLVRDQYKQPSRNRLQHQWHSKIHSSRTLPNMSPLKALVGVACFLYIALILSLLVSFLPMLNFGVGLFLDESSGKWTLGCFMILFGWSVRRFAPSQPKPRL